MKTFLEVFPTLTFAENRRALFSALKISRLAYSSDKKFLLVYLVSPDVLDSGIIHEIEGLITEQYLQSLQLSAKVIDAYEIPENRSLNSVHSAESKPEKAALKSGTLNRSPEKKSGNGGENAGGDRPFRRAKKIEDPNLIYGRAFDDPLQKLSDFSAMEEGNICAAGEIMSVDSRELRNGERSLLSVGITDYTDSISVKMFVKNEELPELLSKLKTGSVIRVKGLAKYDTYDKEVSVSSVYGISLMEGADLNPRRKDLAEKKRVELHCHTKASSNDGIADVEELIKTASGWGHRAMAITDHGCVYSFPPAFRAAKKLENFKLIYGMEGYLVNDGGETDPEVLKKYQSYHIILLAKNETGRVNLYHIVSESSLNYYRRHPMIPRTILEKYREGIIVGSACALGELFFNMTHGASDEELDAIVPFYDYLEIQPLGNNQFLLDDQKYPYSTREDLIKLNEKIVSLGEKHHKPVCATCDVHFVEPGDAIYRQILQAGCGYKETDDQPPLYLHTTDEMLEEFSYLGKTKAYEVVVENTNLIADQIEKIEPVRPDKCPPVIENSDNDLRDACYQRAHELYGDPLPEIVETRLNKELNSIIGNGYAVMYMIAQKLISKSLSDGYLVGSRGSVGSSLAATMSGITEVNPLRPHYRCPVCKYSDFDSEEVRQYESLAGCDMPDKICPKCGAKLEKDGFNIPFETFLGFKGDKEPDIDMNFSGEYQSKAHAYTEVIFGKNQTFRAGTIGSVAERTAIGYTLHYYEDLGVEKRHAEVSRIAKHLEGVRRTTGQHPGGIVVLPLGEDICSFTPVQHPANDPESTTITTCFEYHSIEQNLLKLDILGHDDPTMIRMIQDLTGEDPRKFPLDSPEVMSLFESTEALGIRPEDIHGCKIGALGVPEFGTDFAMNMVIACKPRYLSHLIRIAGMAHGTDVWTGNNQVLIENGTADINTAICCRDDIMEYLISKGVEPSLSFTIMESVRKGKGLKPDWEEEMKAHEVPGWYIWSCKKIQYMFPKAHAAAYVMMAWRIAYSKVFYPLAYYASYFSIRATGFNYEYMCLGIDHLREMMDLFIANDKRSDKEDLIYRDMRVVEEMYARGYSFAPVDIYTVSATRFQIVNDRQLMPSLVSIDGMGAVAADTVVEAAKKSRFISINDFRNRTKVPQTIIEKMVELQILKDLPKEDQFSLFTL